MSRESCVSTAGCDTSDHNGYLWIGRGVADCSVSKRDDSNVIFNGEFFSDPNDGGRCCRKSLIGTWFNGLFRYNEAGFEHILLGRETLTDAVSALLSDRAAAFGWAHIPDCCTSLTGFRQGPKGLLLRKTSWSPAWRRMTMVRFWWALRRDSIVWWAIRFAWWKSFLIPMCVYLHRQRQECMGGHKGGGLDWLKGGHPVHLDTTNGMVGYTIFSVLDDGQGFLWMGTSRGIVRVQRQQLEELAAQKRKTLDYVLLGKADGMPSSECLGVAQPHSTRQRTAHCGLPPPKAWFIRIRWGVPPAAHPAELTGALLDDASVQVNNRLSYRRPGRIGLSVQFANLANPAQMGIPLQTGWVRPGLDGDPDSELLTIESFLPVITVFWWTRGTRFGMNDEVAGIGVYQRPYFLPGLVVLRAAVCGGRGGRGAVVPLEAGSGQGRAWRSLEERKPYCRDGTTH